MERTYAEYAARQAMELLAIDSPTGFTARAADWVQRAFEELGYTARRTAKGGVLVDLGGWGEGLLLEAHADTLGGMVAEVKNSGRLRLTPLGGMRAENGEAENVRVSSADFTSSSSTTSQLSKVRLVSPYWPLTWTEALHSWKVPSSTRPPRV